MNNDLKADPDSAGWVLGWGVVRNSPWSLHGVYATEIEALAESKVAGEDHAVRYGSHKPGTDDFMWSGSN